MILLYQTHSPYARAALVAAYELGLADRLEVVHEETSPMLRNDRVFSVNPLGKVPVLVREGAPPIFDSQAICAFFDSLGELSLSPQSGEARWRALTWVALAQGMNEAGIALRWEIERRPERFRYHPLQEGYACKLDESYDWLERNLIAAQSESRPIDIGSIAVATSLAWLEFRGLPSFRAAHPYLCQWFDSISARASMRMTSFSGETHDGPPLEQGGHRV